MNIYKLSISKSQKYNRNEPKRFSGFMVWEDSINASVSLLV